MGREKPWVRPLKVNPIEFESWTTQVKEDHSVTFWALEKGKIRAQDYLMWAREHYRLPVLKDSFFKDDPSTDLFRQMKSVANWSPEMLPIDQWQGIVYVACVEPPESAQWSFPVRYVLASARSLSWFYAKAKKDAKKTKQPAREEAQKSSVDKAPAPPIPGPVKEDSPPVIPQSESKPISPPIPRKKDVLEVPEGMEGLSGEAPEVPEGMEGLEISLGVEDSKPVLASSDDSSHEVPEGMDSLEIPSGMNSEALTAEKTQPLPATEDVLEMPEGIAGESVVSAEKPIVQPVVQAKAETPESSAPPPAPAQSAPATPEPEPDLAGFEVDEDLEDDEQSMSSMDFTVTRFVGGDMKAHSDSPPRAVIDLDDLSPSSLNAASTDAERLAWAFNELKSHYSLSMILAVNARNLKPFKWESLWVPSGEDALKEFNGDVPGIFRIVLRTSQPYHGYVVDSAANKTFFEAWGYDELPEHVTVLPITAGETTISLLLTIGDSSSASEEALKKAERVTKDLSAALSADFQNVA